MYAQWRPQPDLNRCCRRERPVSWTWLDDGDAKINFLAIAGALPQKKSDYLLFGGPCENRTHDQRIKSPLLYLTELTAHTLENITHPQLVSMDGVYKYKDKELNTGKSSALKLI